MRGRDPETGEFYSSSRSQQREDALEVRSLAQQLVALTPAKLAKLPIPEDLLPHILETQRITSHIAHKRQLQYLAKQMRREEDEVLEAIRDAISEGGDAARRETALLHRAEHWRDRLLDEGDGALAELLEEFPQADRQRLRQLIRNATDERAKNKPPHSYREIFRELRELLGEAGAGNGETGMEDPDADEET